MKNIIVQSTYDNSTTPLPAYVVNGLTQTTASHEICTAFNSHFAASCQFFDSLSVGPNTFMEEHGSSFLNTSNAEVNHSFSSSHVSSRMVAEPLRNIELIADV